MTRRQQACAHLGGLVDLGRGPETFCGECVAEGRGWESLRVCLTCGHVGCGSPGDHAAKHYAETDHPIAVLAGSDPTPRWCYPDRRFV